ncbi:MAG: EAL domain-containing protein [Candidatus Omnitrophica bacterium]|nr:EAL domain-containing protein [Candidatus Omnitrophota bacterium]
MTSQPTKQILLVVRDKELAKSTAQFLQPYNYRVDVAFSGADGLRRLQHVPDLVLLEDALSDMSGLEVCKAIRINELWRGIPIIFFTDNRISTEDMEKLYRYGEDHINKPFDQRELLARVEVALDRSHRVEYSQGSRDIITGEIRKILQNELIIPFFQPIYALPSLELLGVEALSRPFTDSFLSNPELFFKAALTFGMYNEAEKLAWRKAFYHWQRKLGRGKLFLNCTPYFIDQGSPDGAFFSSIGANPECLVVELTERMAIRDHEILLDKLNGMRSLGVQIAVDDVGSGFAGLDTVAEVKPEYIKIDLSLVRDIHLDSLKKNIVQSLITFCHKSGIWLCTLI